MTTRVRRIAVLTADVGEGHLAAARVLAEHVGDAAPEVEVVFVDALEALGPILRLVLLDAYRFQLRRTPVVFHLLFWLFQHVRPLRALGRIALAAFGARRLRARLVAIDPDIVVSTFPAATSVLGALRRSQRITVPAVATITDFAGIPFWVHRGIDLHLVPHESLVAPVEREAGPGSAVTVAPLANKAFRDAAGTGTASRSALNLPHDERVVVVSGGGWGVGDITTAVAEAASLPGTTVVAVTGRNEPLRARLSAIYDGCANVRIVGFTDAMPQLLAAADALVHTTGGVTCLEALTVGCPIVAYGAPAGHAPSLARAMAKLNIAAHPKSRAELRAALCEPPAAVPSGDAPQAGAQLFAARIRTRQAPRNRLRVAVAAASVVSAVLALELATSRTAFGVIRAPLDLGPTTVLPTHQPAVGFIVETEPGDVTSDIQLLAHHGESASFAFRRRPSAQVARLLSAHHDQWLIVLGPSGIDDWLGTADAVQGPRAGAFVLEPSGGISTGQYLLAQLAGGRIVAAASHFERGAIVVWSRGSLARLLAVIASHGLTAAPLGKLSS